MDPTTGNLRLAANFNVGGSDIEGIGCNVGEEDDMSDAPASYWYAVHKIPSLALTPSPAYLGTREGDDDTIVEAASLLADNDDNDGNNDDERH